MTKFEDQSASGSDLQKKQKHKTRELRMSEEPIDIEDELVAMLNERESSLQNNEARPISENDEAEFIDSPSTGRNPRFEEGQVVTLQRPCGAAVEGCVGTVLFYVNEEKGLCEVLFYDILEAGRNNPNDIPNLPSISETVGDGDLEFCKETPPWVPFRVDADGYRVRPKKTTKTKGSKSSSPTAPSTPILKDRLSGFWRKITRAED